jgi:hypothetical protein
VDGSLTEEGRAVQRIRQERKPRSVRADPGGVLPLDPRDPEVVRIKEAMRRHPSAVAKERAAK